MIDSDQEVKEEVHVTFAVVAIFPDRGNPSVKFFLASRTPKSDGQLPYLLLIVIAEKLNHCALALPAM
jgi:hypothetical protein